MKKIVNRKLIKTAYVILMLMIAFFFYQSTNETVFRLLYLLIIGVLMYLTSVYLEKNKKVLFQL